MGTSPPSRLTPLQQDLLVAFFARERRFFLTGGGALAGFYLGHRSTEDLDLFTSPGVDLYLVSIALGEAARSCGAALESRNLSPDFRRFVATRGEETCLVDLVIDRAPVVDPAKPTFGEIRVDSLREIAANKVCTLISRCEVKDLVDLAMVIGSGIDLERAVDDAASKEASAEDPTTLAWILEELRISPEARLPGGFDAATIDAFRRDLITKLREIAFRRASR